MLFAFHKQSISTKQVNTSHCFKSLGLFLFQKIIKTRTHSSYILPVKTVPITPNSLLYPRLMVLKLMHQ